MVWPPYRDNSKILLHLGEKGSSSQLSQFSKSSFPSEIPWHHHHIHTVVAP